ncbi:MAG: PAS domain S-box protein [Proteobacteria bacterium]|nr:PAS domain S-box protein [Pseudomonadota bacterium]
MAKKNHISGDNKAAFKIAVIYLLFSGFWIFFSDHILFFFVQTPEILTKIQTIKGGAFVLITAGLIFFLLQKEIRLQEFAREELKASEEKYRAVVNNTPDLLYRTDRQGKLIFVSPSVYQLTGYSVEEALGMNLSKEVYLYSEEREQLLKELKEKKIVKDFEAQFTRKDGSVFWASTNAHFYKDVNGIVSGIEGIARDVTRKKKIEQALFSREQQLRAILEATPDPMVMYDLNGYPQYVNPSFSQVFGWRFEEIEGKKIAFVPRDQEKISSDKIREIYAHGRPLSFETKRYTKEKKVLDIILSAALVKDEVGTPLGMVVNLTDISERKILEAQYEQAQKMESLGTLAGGIAHDFNNYLGGIFGYLDLALRLTTNEKVQEYLSKVLATSDRARGLTQQLLTFSKGGAPVKAVAPLDPFLQETTRFALSGASVACDFVIPQDLWSCEFDKNQMGQVIDNIVINAHQSMPFGGKVTVTARNRVITPNETLALAPGKYVEISISDTGPGIDPHYISRIFDPFFSTKQQGTGLGLATSYSIIKRHGGIIDVASVKGRGSCFHLYLPATGLTGENKGKAVEKQYRGSGRILIMDDEEVIREMLVEILTGMGFSIVATRDGKEAFHAFTESRNQKNPFRAVILDLTIPGGIGGKETLRRIREIDKKTPVFVASGYSEDTAIAAPESFGFTASLEKPFLISQLARMLEKHLPGSNGINQYGQTGD